MTTKRAPKTKPHTKAPRKGGICFAKITEPEETARQQQRNTMTHKLERRLDEGPVLSRGTRRDNRATCDARTSGRGRGHGAFLLSQSGPRKPTSPDASNRTSFEAISRHSPDKSDFWITRATSLPHHAPNRPFQLYLIRATYFTLAGGSGSGFAMITSTSGWSSPHSGSNVVR